MPTTPLPRLALAALLAGIVLVAIFVTLLLRFRAELHADIRDKIKDHDAAVLYPVALQQLAESEASADSGAPTRPAAWHGYPRGR